MIHTLQLKLRPFEVSPYVCTGKPCVCNVRYVRGGATRAHINVTTITNFLKFRLPACIVWFHYAPSSIIWWFLDNFFLLSVQVALKNKKKGYTKTKQAADILCCCQGGYDIPENSLKKGNACSLNTSSLAHEALTNTNSGLLITQHADLLIPP